MIRALVFDYGGVLMRTVNPLPRRELERWLGLPAGEADRLVFENPLWNEVQLGRAGTADFWADVGQRLGLDAEGLTEFQRGFWAGDRLDEELVALIRHLRREGYRTALLSNGPAGLHGHLEHLGIVDAFDAVVVSGSEGLMKPAPAIFERMLARVGVLADEAVFVDDLRENVAGARQAGLHAVRFRGLAPLRGRLREVGVGVPDPVRAPVPGVRAVIFDWGGVLEELPDDEDTAAWERRLALAPGTLPGILFGEEWRQLELGALGEDAYLQSVAGRLGFPGAEAVLRFFGEFYMQKRLIPQVVTAAHALRGRYKVALLTNAFPGQDDQIRQNWGLDVHAEFDAYVNSSYVGLCKPDPAIFHLMLERLGVAPEQAIFVDDNLHNVDSARQLGLHTVQFVDAATSLGELEALLGHPVQIANSKSANRQISKSANQQIGKSQIGES